MINCPKHITVLCAWVYCSVGMGSRMRLALPKQKTKKKKKGNNSLQMEVTPNILKAENLVPT